jgi:primosomal protein N' (replication factor Y)
MPYFEVLLPIPKKFVLTYFYEEELQIGVRVKVPLVKKEEVGLIYKYSTENNFTYEIKNIIEVLDERPFLTDLDITFLEKLSIYYGYPLGVVFNSVFPKSLLKSEVLEYQKPLLNDSKLAILNNRQKEIYNDIIKLSNKGFSSSLIHGVTGSGKTEIYIEIIKHFIISNKQVLFIVPEISLTPQLIERISERLGFVVDSYHSKMPKKQREKVLWGFKSGELPVVVGARSSLFIPAKDLGLIVVDEEHESSFKQEEAPCYHLRDAAVLKAKIFDIPIVLGSATPSLETYFNTKIGKYHYFKLEQKYYINDKLKINIIDLKNEDVISSILSIPLYDAIYKRLNKNEQVILFLNKKGYSSQLICQKCGKTLYCKNCSVAMTYYKSDESARCHYCGLKINRFVCECSCTEFIDIGIGTEKAYSLLEELFPKDVVKLDADVVTSEKRLKNILEDFKEKKFKILLGTQLIAKGLNFPDVTLVGILNIDNIFSLPDFRNNEKVYQLLTQVAGRAGRFKKSGEIIIQTYNPEMPIFQMIGSDSFYEYELENRKRFEYSPYVRMVRFVFSHIRELKAKDAAKKVESELKSANLNIKMLKSIPAPIYKIKNRYRFHLVIKSKDIREIAKTVKIARRVVENLKLSTLNFKIDVDPYFFL